MPMLKSAEPGRDHQHADETDRDRAPAPRMHAFAEEQRCGDDDEDR